MRTRLSGVAALLAVVVLPGCSAQVAAAPAPPYFQPLPVSVQPGGVFPLLTAYSGWWNTLAFSPGTTELPLRVGLVRVIYLGTAPEDLPDNTDFELDW